MHPANDQIRFDLKCLLGTLFLNTGFCLLLAYKMFTMQAASPEQLVELRTIIEQDLEAEERKTILTKLFDIVGRREITRQTLRNLVLRYALWMALLLVISLVFAIRVLLKVKALRVAG
jgi:hypothetical protein